MVSKTCQQCGTEFFVKPYRADTAKFCSKQCSGVVACRLRLNLGSKEYAKGNKWRVGLRPSNAFTSESVSGSKNVNWVAPVAAVCKFCGSAFERPPHRAYRPDGTNEFCSISCRGRYRSVFLSGPNSPHWKGGKVTNRGANWHESRTAIIVQQKGFCCHCGIFKGKSLCVHHITPFRMFSSYLDANALSNLIGLCQSCHMKMEHQKPVAP